VSRRPDAEFCEYVAARQSSLRRLAAVLCNDWQRADDLLQTALTKLYVHWDRARSADHPDAYARSVLVHEFIREQRSLWTKRVSLVARVSDSPAAAVDHDMALDMRAAIATLPARQRATLVLRYYCDLNVDQCAEVMGCSPGTVKSQTSRALEGVRRVLGLGPDTDPREAASRAYGHTASARSYR
jgi:RNA polymerase sigma-70 factor (sigma-E family)